MTRVRTSLMAAGLLAGVATVGLTPAVAQTTPAPANTPAAQSAGHHHGRMRLMPGQLVDGRIAFLRTELKITPAQEAQWQQYAAAMRQNAQMLDRAIVDVRQHRGASLNAVERMEVRGQFIKLRAENQARLLTAFKPLYASLSPEQQEVANALMASHGGWHHGWHHRT
jgi:periplasmic protein CpxP/Spy